MWKLLRIGALLALVALGALKFAQSSAARGQMERIAAALAPTVRLSYADVTGALDGRVILDSPRIEILTGPMTGAVLGAHSATIESPGTFWLLQRALGKDASVPAALGVHLRGTSFSQDALDRYGQEGWFGTTGLVPFESIGCGTAALTGRDYARMGVSALPREDDLRYIYDATSQSLRADIVSTSAPFSTITAHLELSAFAPSAWFGDAPAAKAQRIEQFSLTYLDGGYFAKRNRFCAQLTGTDAADYAGRHLAAVKAFLDVRGVTLGDDVATLYRKLIADGGSADISSLPDAAFVPADFAGYGPDDLLRQLNVTLRRNTAPPILMRLTFASPSEDPSTAPSGEAVAADTGLASDAAVAETTEAAAAIDALPVSSAPASEPLPAAKSEGMPLLSVANAAVVPVEMTPAPLPAPPAEVLAVATPEPSTIWSVVDHPSVDPRNAVEGIPASAPLPPSDSTAALVWRAPTIERLPERIPERSDYVSVSTGSLAGHVGERVRLLTAGGKRVEGRVQRMDGADVVVVIHRDGGSAEMRIPEAGIRDAKVHQADH